eukprot:8454485-Ditylum_brightwellii.AAC.1
MAVFPKTWSELQDKHLRDIKLHLQRSNGASWTQHNNYAMARTNKASKGINKKYYLQKLKHCTCPKLDH